MGLFVMRWFVERGLGGDVEVGLVFVVFVGLVSVVVMGAVVMGVVVMCAVDMNVFFPAKGAHLLSRVFD